VYALAGFATSLDSERTRAQRWREHARSRPDTIARDLHAYTPKFDKRPHNDLLTSVCRAVGLDNQSFGDARFNTGPIMEIFG